MKNSVVHNANSILLRWLAKKPVPMLGSLQHNKATCKLVKKIDINVVSFHAGLAMPYVGDYIHKVYAHGRPYTTVLNPHFVKVSLCKTLLGE